MYGILRRQVENAFGDAQERLTLSIETLLPREAGNVLFELHDLWWKRSAGGGEPPCVDGFDYKSLLPAEFHRYVSWVDLSAADPYNYVIRDHTHQSQFCDHTDRRLGDHPSRMNTRSCAAEYIACIRDRRPFYHEIDQTVGSISRQYRRMMLPIANARGKVERLVYAVRMVSGSTSSS
jgi:hypothetical protein